MTEGLYPVCDGAGSCVKVATGYVVLVEYADGLRRAYGPFEREDMASAYAEGCASALDVRSGKSYVKERRVQRLIPPGG